MPCRNPCKLYIHLAFNYSIGPSSVVWSELGPAPPFPPMRVLEVQWSRALSLVCEVALRTSQPMKHILPKSRGTRSSSRSKRKKVKWRLSPCSFSSFLKGKCFWNGLVFSNHMDVAWNLTLLQTRPVCQLQIKSPIHLLLLNWKFLLEIEKRG